MNAPIFLLSITMYLCVIYCRGFLLNSIKNEVVRVPRILLMSSKDSVDVVSIYGKEEKLRKSNKKRIMIAGGGFGGLYTALALSKLSWMNHEKPDIILVDRKEKFVYTPLLYDLAAETADFAEVTPLYKSLLIQSGVKFMQGNITRLDLCSKNINVKNTQIDNLDGIVISDENQERCFGYDQLVLALGAQPVIEVKGARDYSYPFYSIEQCYRLRTKLRYMILNDLPTVDVVVIGGNICAVEVSTMLVEKLTVDGQKNVNMSLITRASVALDTINNSNRQTGCDRLNELKVNILTLTEVIEVQENGVIVKNINNDQSWTIKADLIVWTAGSKANALLQQIDAPKDRNGRIIVNDRFSVPNFDGVYCIGDAAAVDGFDYTPSAQLAMAQSEYLAWNIWATMTGYRTLPFRYNDLGQILSLGPSSGSLSALNSKITLRGLPAAAARRAVYALRMPTIEQRIESVTSIAYNTAEEIMKRGSMVLSRFMKTKEK